LRVTKDHPFFVDDRWIKASELAIGNTMIDISGRNVEVVSLEWVDFGVRVYNLDVLTPDTFYAGGYLVHNKPIIGEK
jgi:intein/homing endonuclease